MKNKEEAKREFIKTFSNSWTFGKMTEEEKERCLTIFTDNVKGNFEQRWKIYNEIYQAFLIGLGYSGFNWRETETQPF